VLKVRNPINAVPGCLQGQKLPANWQSMARDNAIQATAAYQERLENAWKNAGNTANQNQPPMRAARLTNDSADYAHDGHNSSGSRVSGGRQERCDGQMKLIEERSDGWQYWRDSTTGATVWRRIKWSDLVGEK